MAGVEREALAGRSILRSFSIPSEVLEVLKRYGAA